MGTELAKVRDYDDHQALIVEWGGLMPIIDPNKVTSGSVEGQRNAINRNLHVFPHLIELAKNDLVNLEAAYNDEYLKLNDSMDDQYCKDKNIKANQKNIYIEKMLTRKPDSIGSSLRKVKNRVKSLEGAQEAQMNLLWTYNKGNR